FELDLPDPRQLAAAVYEIDDAAAHTPDRGDRELPRPVLLLEGFRAQRAGARHGRLRVLDPDAERIGVGAVNQVGGVRKALPLGIDDDVDAALGPSLPPQNHVLAAMPGLWRETHARKQHAELGGLFLVGREF